MPRVLAHLLHPVAVFTLVGKPLLRHPEAPLPKEENRDVSDTLNRQRDSGMVLVPRVGGTLGVGMVGIMLTGTPQVVMLIGGLQVVMLAGVLEVVMPTRVLLGVAVLTGVLGTLMKTDGGRSHGSGGFCRSQHQAAAGSFSLNSETIFFLCVL